MLRKAKKAKGEKATDQTVNLSTSKKPKEVKVNIGRLDQGHPQTPYVVNLRDIHVRGKITEIEKQHTIYKKSLRAARRVGQDISKLKAIGYFISDMASKIRLPRFQFKSKQSSKINFVPQAQASQNQKFSVFKKILKAIGKGIILVGSLFRDFFIFIKILPKEIAKARKIVQIKPLLNALKPKPKKEPVIKKETEKKTNKTKLITPTGKINYKKSALTLAALSLAMIVPIKTVTYYSDLNASKNKIFNEVMQAVEYMQAGTDSAGQMELDQSIVQFGKAAYNFSQAQQEIENINIVFDKLIKAIPEQGEQYSSGKNIVALGENLALAATYIDHTAKDATNPDKKLIEKIQSAQDNLALASEQLSQAIANLNEINQESIPTEYQEIFTEFKQALPATGQALNEVVDFTKGALEFLGKPNLRRYLVIFQNNYELRPTGGFMGSFALVDIEEGEIKNIEIPKGGAYDITGQLREKVLSPQPMHLVNPYWGFQDANWWFDFPTSARKIMWFYEKGGGPTVDGVVAVNASVMGSLLEITGPIKMPEYNRTIDAENFMDETHKIVELETDKQESKKFIGDLFEKLMADVKNFEKDKQIELLKMANSLLNQKEIQLYFSNQQLQELISKYNWDGAVEQTQGDYLAIVNTNIGGAKSDNEVEKKAFRKVNILPDGTIRVNLMIFKEHLGSKENIFTGQNNIDYIRIYTPENSKLISAKGFDIIPESEIKPVEEIGYEPDQELLKIEESIKTLPGSNVQIYNEFRKTVFAGWILTNTGKKSLVELEYELPFKLAASSSDNIKQLILQTLNLEDKTGAYKFLLQKQSGSELEYKQIIEFDNSFGIVWLNQEKYQNISEGKIISEGMIEKDQVNNILFEF